MFVWIYVLIIKEEMSFEIVRAKKFFCKNVFGPQFSQRNDNYYGIYSLPYLHYLEDMVQ